VLHLIGRIGVLNRGNIAPVRQIESIRSLSLAWAKYNRHINGMIKPAPRLAEIAAQFIAARHRVESRRIYDHRSPHREPHRTTASHSGHRSVRAFLLVKRIIEGNGIF